jgi:hypothetical protein
LLVFLLSIPHPFFLPYTTNHHWSLKHNQKVTHLNTALGQIRLTATLLWKKSLKFEAYIATLKVRDYILILWNWKFYGFKTFENDDGTSSEAMWKTAHIGTKNFSLQWFRFSSLFLLPFLEKKDKLFNHFIIKFAVS